MAAKGKLIAVQGATISCPKSTVLGMPTSNFLHSTSDIETCCCNDSILTINDDGVGVNIRPFQGCSLTPDKRCTPIPHTIPYGYWDTAWKKAAQPFGDIEERVLTEESYFICANTGMTKVKIANPGQEDLRVGDEFDVCEKEELSIEEARVRAFLRMIQVGEGTLGKDGYETLFGGSSFIDRGRDFSDHPYIVITAGGYSSSAAGSYQILNKTWNSYANLRTKYGINDFSPLSQDLFGVALVGDVRGALDEVMAGDIEGAIRLTNREWASLPESPYGQPTTTMNDALEHFDDFLAEELNGQTTLHLPNGFLEDYGFVDP